MSWHISPPSLLHSSHSFPAHKLLLLPKSLILHSLLSLGFLLGAGRNPVRWGLLYVFMKQSKSLSQNVHWNSKQLLFSCGLHVPLKRGPQITGFLKVPHELYINPIFPRDGLIPASPQPLCGYRQC